MAERGDEILQRVLAKGSLPSLSPIAVRLVEMAADDQSSAGDLARLISQDPGLTARLLRLANSPAFRRWEGDITNVNRAVVLLGLREVRIMALSLSLRDTLPFKKAGPDYHLFWRASLHRAVLAREVARRLALKDAEESFVAALILEMGLPLLLRVLSPEEMQGFPGMGASLRRQMAWERQGLGLDHRRVGALVMERWGLPRSLVACQQTLEEGDRERVPLLVEVCDFARRGTEAFFLPETHLTDIYQVAWRYFGFDDETVNNLLATTLLFTAEAAGAMDLGLDQEADLLEVMERANAALSRLSHLLEPHLAAAARAEQDLIASSGDQGRRLQEEAVTNTLEAVAHEIRNPLMSVGGFARRLARQAQGAVHLQKYAEVIVAEAARLDQVLGDINRLLAPYHPTFRGMDLNDIMRALAQEFPTGGEGQGQVLPRSQWQLPPVPVALNADPQGLGVALRQLLGYACHLMQGQKQGELCVALEADNQEAWVTVRGPGQPPPPDQDAMADRSFGPALSLSQARRILEAHGGGLEVAQAQRQPGFVITARLCRWCRAA